MSDAPSVLKIVTPTQAAFFRAFTGCWEEGLFFLRNRAPLAPGRKVRVEIVTRDGAALLTGEADVVSAHGAGNKLRFSRLDDLGTELLAQLAIIDGDVIGTRLSPARPEPVAPVEAAWAFPEELPTNVVVVGPPPPPAPARIAVVESLPSPPQAPLEVLSVSEALTAPLVSSWRNRPACFEFPELGAPVSERWLGIDLGTAFSGAGFVQDGKPELIRGSRQRPTFSSAVWVDGTDYLVGEAAMDRIEREPQRVVHSWKRLLGRRFESEAVQDALEHLAYEVQEGPNGEAAVRVGNLLCQPGWFAARTLYEVRARALERLEVAIENAVIAVPAHYTDLQRVDVREAAKLAGFRNIRFLTEPVAAAIAYGMGKGSRKGTLLTYDFGGGTFDASVLDVDGLLFQVVATGGDPFLGGVDFDDRILGFLLVTFLEKERIDLTRDPAALVRVALAAERAKRELSERNEVRVSVPFAALRDGKGIALDVMLTRAKLEEMTVDLVERSLTACEDTLAQAGRPTSELDDVVLIGGITRIPLVQRRVAEHFGRAPRKNVHPDEAVALGAALFADSLGRDDGMEVFDVVSLGVGIRAPDGASFLPIIPAGASLPGRKTHAVRADGDSQTSFQLDVFQGNSTRLALCDYRGTVEAEGLAPSAGRSILAEVQFQMSEDATLTIAFRQRAAEPFRPLVLKWKPGVAPKTRAAPRGMAYVRRLLGGR